MFTKRLHLHQILLLNMNKMFVKEALVALCILLNCLQSTQVMGVDSTLQPEAYGVAVVDATVAKLNQLVSDGTGSLQPDSRFMRRIAWVETQDGTAGYTYSDPDYHGGIWRVDRSVFDLTKRMFNLAEFSGVFHDIERIFCITWIQTTWNDCRKPLYSALAARLFFHHQSLSIPSALPAQAQKWESEYHDQPTDTAENFELRVKALEEAGCRAKGIDLVFVLDGSGSVSARDFVKTQNFVLNMVDFFSISANNTRVGVMQFGIDVTTEFNLNEHFDNVSLKWAIADIIYKAGSRTFTALALEIVGNVSFLPENGGRIDRERIPRVAVVITDGMSNDVVGNVTANADSAREKGIVIFAIGVTSSVEDQELKNIANKPSDTYVFHVEDFDAIASITATLENTACRQASEIPKNESVEASVSMNEIQNFQVPVTGNEVEIKMNATSGSTIVYISLTTPNPNEAFNDYQLMATEGDGEPVSVVIGPGDFNKTCTPANTRRRRQVESQDGADAGTVIGTIYVTIEGLQDTNDFVLTVTEGDFPEAAPTTKKPAMKVTNGDSTNGCGFVVTTMAYTLLPAASVQLLTSTLY